VHRTGELYGQFETLEQQKESASLGMWVFLSTEVLFFGGLFMTYTLNRHYYGAAFAVGSNTLDLKLGTMNTIILIASSLTMALSVWASSLGKKAATTWCLILTLVLGTAFLGVKLVEYKQKFDHHLVPGYHFQLDYRAQHPGPNDDPKEIAREKEELEKGLARDPDISAHSQLYYSLYFGMTGLHALHMVVGAGMLVWLIRQSIAGRFTATYNTPVDLIGLYWHFVDIVWIYLFPLLYLIDRHQ
jgi:cytochrome c oxidase subunit 3